MKTSRLVLTLVVCWLGCTYSEKVLKNRTMVPVPVWQWSVTLDSVVSRETNDHPEAYLWIPENCEKVRGVILTQNNMIEEGMLERLSFRKRMRELGLAEVWVDPMFAQNFDFHSNIPAVFQEMMQDLADESGYKELATAPVIPMGHSSCATFPWNFAVWNPERTLALISVHGDAPQTHLTGYGRPNVDWEDRDIDGVPALFAMGEFEWWEDRLTPGFAYRQKHPKSTITWFADAGHGHFDYSDALVDYICLFIKKVVEQRLPEMRHLNPESGWLMDRWRKDSLPEADAAPYAQYKGDRNVASWVFDKEMAEATEAFYTKSRGKKQQYIGLIQNDEVLMPDKSHANYHVEFEPLEDGISFRFKAFFADSTRVTPVVEHAATSIQIDPITGPVMKLNDSTFQIRFSKLGFNSPKRSNDIWLLAHNEGDETYKSTVQQFQVRFPLFNKEGQPQEITFPEIEDQKVGTKAVQLEATSSAGVPVSYYVRKGPAYIKDDQLIFTFVPPGAKLPLKVEVVAWQYGKAGELQSAEPVERSFQLLEK